MTRQRSHPSSRIGITTLAESCVVNRKARVFWPLGMLLLLTDCATKSLA